MAYTDEPLPIAGGQTISQPLIVALMTEALELKGPEKVLEIGTGSGYQTAILAELAAGVVTTERLEALSQSAQSVLDRIGYRNIVFKYTPHNLGWPESVPYQAIIVTAAAPRIPETLIEQLDINGRLVIPVGPRDSQELYQLIRRPEGNLTRSLGGCRFVPLIADEAWRNT
jgi:protein-L-isoaspartate(D-aspartate) O-methyltransferase